MPHLITLTEEKNSQFVQLSNWQQLDSRLTAGITTRKGGLSTGAFDSFNMGLHVADSFNAVIKNREKLADLLHYPLSSWVSGEQVHGVEIAEVTEKDCGKGAKELESAIKGVDGLYTFSSNLLLTAFFADCVPLFFFAPKHHFIGIAHAGWRGSVRNMAGAMVHEYAEVQQLPLTDLYAAVGPSIGACCYEVDDNVIREVNVVAANASDIYVPSETKDRFLLNLQALNVYLLKKAGLDDDHITVADSCTSCSSDVFYSHRRDAGQTGRMLGFIGLSEE